MKTDQINPSQSGSYFTSENLPAFSSWKEFGAMLESLADSKKNDQAAALCQEALRLHPHSPFPHHLMACLLAPKDPQLAKAHCCAALCFDPCFHRAAWNLKALCENQPLCFDPECEPLQEEGRIVYDGHSAAALFRLPLELAFLYDAKTNTSLKEPASMQFSSPAAIPVLILHEQDSKNREKSIAGRDDPEDCRQAQKISQLAQSVLSQSLSLQEKVLRQIRYGSFRLDPAQHCAYIKDQRIDLTPLEYELLCALSDKPGENISSEDLLLTIYGEYYGSNTQALRTLIAGLRRKLARSGLTRDLIVTVPGFGYRLAFV